MAEYRPIYKKECEWKNTGTPDGEIQVFHPTPEEFANFPKYIEKIERANAHLSSGICKVVPPPGWNPRPSMYPGDYSNIDDFIIESPVRERIEGGINTGCYVKNNIVYRKAMRVADFRKLAFNKGNRPPKPEYDLVELEKYFWRNLLHHEPIYGADTPGSIYDANVREFNMNRLGSILDLLKEQNITIRGVNTVFLYFGMWKTMFPWHAEDMDLYSINYNHFGEPKFWYAIPSQAAERFERLAAQRFPDGLNMCKAFLRHKLYIISPTVLKNNNIPYGTMVQYPGEFIITFPKGYHMGFNVGYNCAESTNFALERWIDYGKNAVLCYCRNDTVEIDMRPFMQKYRPDEYKEWFDYWYGERPTSYKPKKVIERCGNATERASSTRSSDDTSSEENLTMACTKRQRQMFKARMQMKDLWANQPVNLFAEKEHNTRTALHYPHCSVCQYFVRRSIWLHCPAAEKLPERSKRYVTDQMFEKERKLDGVRVGEEDALVECANCRVVVHVGCYPKGGTRQKGRVAEEKPASDGEQGQTNGGEGYEAAASSSCDAQLEWLCERCFDRNDVLIRAASCQLCELRGGALVETSQRNAHGGQCFVHVICAIMDQETRFLDPAQRRLPFSPPPRRLLPQALSLLADHDYSCCALPCTSSALAAPPTPALSTEKGNTSKTPEQEGQDEASPTNTDNAQSAAPSLSVPSPLVIRPIYGDQPISAGSSPSLLNNLPSSPGFSAKKPASICSDSYPASYQCEVCGHQSEHLIRCDVCVELEEALGAKLRFHVTCAPIADVTFECRLLSQSATASLSVCAFHNSAQGLEEDEAIMDPRRFDVNQRVIVHLEDEKLIGWARILSITEHLFATVDFLDGSVSTDTFLCDILDCECKLFGCSGGSHIPGFLVYVHWNEDGRTYAGYYRGKTPVRKYRIRLLPPTSFDLKKLRGDDIVEVTGESIFRRDDLLPEVVRMELIKRKSLEPLE